MKEIILALTLIFVGAGLVAFGAHGCSNGSHAHGFAIFAGIMLLSSQVSSKKSKKEKEDEVEGGKDNEETNE